MSDKCYVPVSGRTYVVKHAPRGGLEVQEGSGKPTPVKLDCSSERIDHQTQRIVLDRGTGRRLFWVYSVRNKRVLAWPGGSIELDALDLTEGSAGPGGKLKPLKLTMPGKVLNVKVREGDTVEAGQGLVIVEAMKMENLLLSPGKAKVLKVHIKAGDRLESGATLITFGPAE